MAVAEKLKITLYAGIGPQVTAVLHQAGVEVTHRIVKAAASPEIVCMLVVQLMVRAGRRIGTSIASVGPEVIFALLPAIVAVVPCIVAAVVNLDPVLMVSMVQITELLDLVLIN